MKKRGSRYAHTVPAQNIGRARRQPQIDVGWGTYWFQTSRKCCRSLMRSCCPATKSPVQARRSTRVATGGRSPFKRCGYIVPYQTGRWDSGSKPPNATLRNAGTASSSWLRTYLHFTLSCIRHRTGSEQRHIVYLTSLLSVHTFSRSAQSWHGSHIRIHRRHERCTYHLLASSLLPS